MRYFNVLLLVLFINVASAQNYLGYLSDNYSGLHGVTLNPANVTDSKFRTEINLFSANAMFNNDYFVLDMNSLSNGTDIDNTDFVAKENNNFAFNFDVMGPSFMFNLSPKHSIGIITRGRAFFNVNKIKGKLFDAVEDDFDSQNDFTLTEDEFTTTLHGWAEFGIAYGRTLIDKEQHFLKAGVTVKYLQGLGNAYTKANNLSVDFDADGFAPGVGTIATTGQIEYGSSQGISEDGGDFQIESGSNGFGADLGFIYEWRPNPTDIDNDSRSNYKLKIGLSITDIGSINYKNAEANTYDITNTIDEDTYESEENFEDKLNNLYTRTGSADFTKVSLPTALHLT
ncbi:MAG: hypothetical protein KDD05_02000, partial [Psychroserpens sp.]|nr:hypothetical protein [Psychroserpens sp.]